MLGRPPGLEDVDTAGEISVQIRQLTKRFDGQTAVDELNLEIGTGEFLVLLGPSGCGKTTTMRSIAGLETPDTGAIAVNGRTVFNAATGVDVPVNRRNVGMVFQSYAIWPHMTVFDNVAYSLKLKRLPRGQIRKQVNAMLDVVGLGDFGDRGASKLSGGQMQRVALARSLVMEPDVLLLDEPLSNLDAKLRERLRFELKELQQRLGTTAVYVTHDQSEALALADRVAVMDAGRIIQLGDPIELYRRPRTRFVADFLGSSNIVEATIESQSAGSAAIRLVHDDHLVGPLLDVDVDVDTRLDRPVCVSIRPEVIELGPATAAPAAGGLVGTVSVSSFLGDHFHYFVALDAGPQLQVKIPATGEHFRAGNRVEVTVPRSAVRLLEAGR